MKAIDAAINALEEAEPHPAAALRAADFDPAELERIEERLFALRAASRKYPTPVDGLAALAAALCRGRRPDRRWRGAAEGAGEGRGAADERYKAAATKLSASRAKAADKLDKAVNGELTPSNSSARPS